MVLQQPEAQHDSGTASPGVDAAGRTAHDERLEALVAQLRQSYGQALAFTRDLPVLGRCEVEVTGALRQTRTRRRWVARLPARLYVETHVRRQLDHLEGCLRDEMLDPAKHDRWRAIVASLGEAASGLRGWRRVKELFLRLPPVAASVPVLVAATANPLGDLDAEKVRGSVTVLLATTFFAYLLVVWPSLKLGFRIKRAIFCGGLDLANPWAAHPGTARWAGVILQRPPSSTELLEGLAAWWKRRREREPRPLLRLPELAVYRDERIVFDYLGRRKRDELPIDLVLALGPYLKAIVAGVTFASYVAYLAGGGATENPEQLLFAPLMLLTPLIPLQLAWQLRANAWRRREQSEHAHERRSQPLVEQPAAVTASQLPPIATA